MPSAPDYTNAALVMGWVNLMWIFMALWAVFGFTFVLLTGFFLDRMIMRMGRRA